MINLRTNWQVARMSLNAEILARPAFRVNLIDEERSSFICAVGFPVTKVPIGHNSGAGFVEDETLSLSDKGYEFQFRFNEALITRLAGFSTVTLLDMNGNVVTLENYRRRGRDGGMDLVYRIEARSEAAARGVATRIRNIISEIQF